MSAPEIFDATPCELGEGPLWHPLRQQLFWFDIYNRTLFSRTDAGLQSWTFDELCSAAGWVDERTLLVASETRLFTLDLGTGRRTDVAPLEADTAATRSNDGRADPQGGFWIGTMAKVFTHHAGGIYRYYRGEVRLLFPHITIPNAICFAPDGTRAYFADTPARKIMTVTLDADGWPNGAPEVFVDLHRQYNPDGAVCDAEGNVWNAQWGAARVAVYAPDGRFLREIALDAAHTSCPAFGGPDLTDLYVTSALEHIPADEVGPADGCTFRVPGAGRGQAEHRVIL